MDAQRLVARRVPLAFAPRGLPRLLRSRAWTRLRGQSRVGAAAIVITSTLRLRSTGRRLTLTRTASRSARASTSARWRGSSPTTTPDRVVGWLNAQPRHKLPHCFARLEIRRRRRSTCRRTKPPSSCASSSIPHCAGGASRARCSRMRSASFAATRDPRRRCVSRRRRRRSAPLRSSRAAPALRALGFARLALTATRSRCGKRCNERPGDVAHFASAARAGRALRRRDRVREPAAVRRLDDAVARHAVLAARPLSAEDAALRRRSPTSSPTSRSASSRR